VVLGARRVERLESLAGEIRAAGGQALVRPLDVTRRGDVEAFVQAAKGAFGRVDVVVNNAGIMPLGPLAALQVEEWDRTIDVNLRGVLHGIAAALPLMKEQGSGQFINVASIGAHQVYPMAAVYCATKYAVWAVSEGLRLEHNDIRVTIISPGVVESELADTIADPDFRAAVQKMRSVALSPDAIARAIRYAIEQPADVDVSEIIVRPTQNGPF
jgi:NADP-dependent 3-hydroxy acid dehydrogenase YdfG